MRSRVPSLGALMAFSAAAKHLSVTRAASELRLTESAVSRQIAQLETQLGVKLFYRIKKRITLTRAGAAYSTRAAQTIERVERDALEIMGYEADGWFWMLRRCPPSARNGLFRACRTSTRAIPALPSM